MNRGFWTDERVEELRSRWADNETATVIADAMGAKSRSSIIAKARRLDLKKRISPVQKDRKTKVGLDMAVYKFSKTEKRNKVANTAYGQPVKKISVLNSNQCIWPIGDPRKNDFHFCGGDVHHRGYCKEHAAIAYRIVRVKEA